MKKVLSFLISLCMIASITAVCSFSSAAASDTLVFSMTETTADPGKTVDITVNIDENPGFWSVGIVFYYSDKLTLRDISYGTLTPESYYFNSSMNVSPDDLGTTIREAIDRVGVDTDGLYAVFVLAENEDSIVDNITGTGKLITLSFEVASDAPAGDYIVGATIRDSGDFVDAETISEVPVEFKNVGKITVSGSTSSSDGSVNYGTPSNPDAAGSAGYYEQHPEYAPENQTDIAENEVTPQTDSDGNVMTDAEGQIIPSETDSQEYRVVTDDSGSIVYETDTDGNKTAKTEKVVDTSEANESGNSSTSTGVTYSTIAIVLGIVLVCAGAAVIIFVFATRSKAEEGKDGNDDESITAEASDASKASDCDESSDADQSDANENDNEAEKQDEE